MNILTINTASQAIEVTLKTDDQTAYYFNEKKEMASISLVPEVEKLTLQLSTALSNIDYFGVVIGPGSFTGIRIGISTVRAFCQTLNKKAVLVNRLELLAYTIRNRLLSGDLESITKCDAKEPNIIVSTVDGQNGISYIGVFNFSDLKEKMQFFPYKTEELEEYFLTLDPSKIIVSDYILPLKEQIAEVISVSREEFFEFVEDKIKGGFTVEFGDIVPLYIRKSQAERQAGEL